MILKFFFILESFIFYSRLIEKHKDNPRFNINCRDAVGRTSLIVAIENENMELIDLLLTNNVQAGDALLHAISEEYVEAVEVLLQHEEKTYTPGKPYVRYYLTFLQTIFFI